jgi:hypothetical protein
MQMQYFLKLFERTSENPVTPTVRDYRSGPVLCRGVRRATFTFLIPLRDVLHSPSCSGRLLACPRAILELRP